MGSRTLRTPFLGPKTPILGTLTYFDFDDFWYGSQVQPNPSAPKISGLNVIRKYKI